MSNESKDDSNGSAPGGQEKRKGERRDPERDRRNADRVVTESKPRRQNPGRRNSDK